MVVFWFLFYLTTFCLSNDAENIIRRNNLMEALKVADLSTFVNLTDCDSELLRDEEWVKPRRVQIELFLPSHDCVLDWVYVFEETSRRRHEYHVIKKISRITLVFDIEYWKEHLANESSSIKANLQSLSTLASDISNARVDLNLNYEYLNDLEIRDYLGWLSSTSVANGIIFKESVLDDDSIIEDFFQAVLNRNVSYETRELILRDVIFDEDIGKIFATALEHFPHLQILIFEGIECTSEIMSMILKSLARHNHKLEYLGFSESDDNLYLDSFINLITMGSFARLKSLIFEGLAWYGFDFVALLNALENNNRIQSLALNGFLIDNSIEDYMTFEDEMQLWNTLYNTVSSMRSLRKLSLPRNICIHTDCLRSFARLRALKPAIACEIHTYGQFRFKKDTLPLRNEVLLRNTFERLSADCDMNTSECNNILEKSLKSIIKRRRSTYRSL